jgi:membrane-associated protease RseP (regulator of RpoE activity)
LWKRKFNGVEYRISAIPLGGYVSIPDVDPEGTKVLEGESARGDAARVRIPAWKEVLVALAGPLMNVFLAVAIAILLAIVPGAKFGELPSEIGSVVEGGAAAAGGLRAGDVVKSVGGRQVRTWTQMQTEVQISGGRETVFEVERKGEGLLRLSVTPMQDKVTGAYYIMALSITNNAGAASWMPDRNPIRQLAWDAGSIFRVLKGLVTPKEAKATKVTSLCQPGKRLR